MSQSAAAVATQVKVCRPAGVAGGQLIRRGEQSCPPPRLRNKEHPHYSKFTETTAILNTFPAIYKLYIELQRFALQLLIRKASDSNVGRQSLPV